MVKDWKGIQLNHVNHQQAMKLKRLGFDSNCESVWINDGKDWRFEEKEPAPGLISGEVFMTPTVELALKWLRHKKNIHVGSSRKDHCNFIEIIDDENNTRISMSSGINFMNREDADMHGLDVALDYLNNRRMPLELE